MDRPGGRAPRLSVVVVDLHDVRCRMISVLQHFCVGPPGGDIFLVFGRRIGPGGYLERPGDEPRRMADMIAILQL